MSNLREYTVIALYLIFLFGIGWAFRKFNRNTSDYFRSGCQGAWWMVGISVFISGVSSRTFTANSGVAFDAGWSIWLVYLGGLCGGIIEMVYLAPRFRQMRATTFPEVVKLRYGITLQQFNAFIGLFGGLVGASLILWSLGVFCNAVFGIDINVLIVALGLVVLFYSVAGGRWAVMATDFLQTLIMVPMAILVTVLCLHKVGGIDGFFALVAEKGLADDFAMIKPADAFPGGAYGPVWALSMFISSVFGSLQLGAAVRYFSVKTGREARKAAAISTLLAGIGMMFWLFPPMVSRLLFEDAVLGAGLSKPAEAAYAIAAVKLLPASLVGLVVVAMFAAAMSTMDTALNANAAMLTVDIYPWLCRVFGKRPMPEKKQFFMAQVFSVIFGLLTIGMALKFSSLRGVGIFEVMMSTTALIHIPMLMPLIMGLFVRRAPRWGAFFTIGATLAVELFGRYVLKTPAVTRILVNMIVGAVAYMVTTLFWRYEGEVYRQQVASFFTRMNTPVDFAAEVGETNDISQLDILGKFSVGLGVFVLGLLLFPNTWSARFQILFVAACSLAIGSSMLVAEYRRKRDRGAPAQ